MDKVHFISCHDTFPANHVRLQFLDKQDAQKSDKPAREKNCSQVVRKDNTDIMELDKLLAEIQSLDHPRDAQAFSQNGIRIISEGFDRVKSSKSNIAADKSAFISEYSRAASFDCRFIHLLTTQNRSDSERKRSESDVRENPLLNKLNQAKNQEFLQNNTHQLKKHMQTVQQPPSKVLDLLHSNSNIPSQSKIQPLLMGVVSKSKSKDQAPVFVSDSENKALEVAQHSAVPGKASDSGQGFALSLADLAKQHKSQRAKFNSLNESSPVISRKINDDMASLSTLVAQFSAQKKSTIENSPPDHSGSFGGSSENEKLGNINSQDIKSKPVVIGSSSFTSSQAALSIANSQAAEKSSNVSLSQLAEQHRHLKNPMFTVSHQSGQLNAAKPSLASLLKNMTLEDTKFRQHREISSAAKTSSSLSKLSSTEIVPNLSLAICLKTGKTSGTATRKSNNTQQKTGAEDSHVVASPSQMDFVEFQPFLDSQEKVTHTDLISQVSCLGLVLCYTNRKRKVTNDPPNPSRPLKYKKFMCRTQVGNRKLYVENIHPQIKPFDFSTPSPDDIVKNKQKQAFTRPDKEFEF